MAAADDVTLVNSSAFVLHVELTSPPDERQTFLMQPMSATTHSLVETAERGTLRVWHTDGRRLCKMKLKTLPATIEIVLGPSQKIDCRAL
jgi:hypothetical protein